MPSISKARARSWSGQLSVISVLHRLAARWAAADRLGTRGASSAQGARRVAGDPCRPERLSPTHPWNEIVVDGRGNAYVNNIGFDFPGGEFAPGIIALVTPDGSARQVADGVAFPNGMAVTPDNSTLIVAESYGNKLTAFDIAPMAACRTGGCGPTSAAASPTASASTRKAPSGTATSPTSAACACAKAARCCRRSSSTAAASPACSGARTGERCSWWPTSGAAPENMADGSRTGQVLTVEAPAASAGWP